MYKEPSIKMQNVAAHKQIERLQARILELSGQPDEIAKVHAEIEELNKTLLMGSTVCTKSGFELIEFEEWVG
jgi:hypothetical protein